MSSYSLPVQLRTEFPTWLFLAAWDAGPGQIITVVAYDGGRFNIGPYRSDSELLEDVRMRVAVYDLEKNFRPF